MKTRPKLTDSDKPASPKRGGHRALRVAKRKAYYASVPAKTQANKKRRLARHIRRFPEELTALEVWGLRYGKAALPQFAHVPCARAVRRIKRRAREARTP